MCTFITSWVSEGGDKSRLASILNEHGFDLDEYPGSPIRAKLKGPVYFRPTRSYCDCGTALGSSHRKGGKEASMETRIEGLRSKGWGEAKITRWVEEQERIRKKNSRAEEARSARHDRSASIEHWMSLLEALLDKHGYARLGILFHHYHGNQSLEDFELKAAVKLDLADLKAADFAEMRPDTPYEIAKKGIRPKTGTVNRSR